jgi:hypothetical protein
MMHGFYRPVLPTFTKQYLFLYVGSWVKKNSIEVFLKIVIWCKVVRPVLESAYKNKCENVIYFLYSHILDWKYKCCWLKCFKERLVWKLSRE